MSEQLTLIPPSAPPQTATSAFTDGGSSGQEAAGRKPATKASQPSAPRFAARTQRSATDRVSCSAGARGRRAPVGRVGHKEHP